MLGACRAALTVRMCLQLLDFWPAWRVWRSVHFAPHLLMFAVMLTGLVIPPRRPKGSGKKAGEQQPGQSLQASFSG